MPGPSISLLARGRDERGFGMIELLMSMTIMLVGVVAVFGLFQSGLVQIQRASTVTTAGALATAEMERFRAVKYGTLGLDPATAVDSTYTADTAYAADTSPATTLTAAIDAAATTLTVTSAASFPPAPEFRVAIDDELLLVTATSGATWTVARGADGTSAAPHALGATVTLKRRVDVESCSTAAPPCTELLPTKTSTGADGKTYRVDTYVTWAQVATQGGASGRALKQVTVVVRDAAAPYRAWGRAASIFDESTGL